MDEYKNRFEKILDDIKKYVEPSDDWFSVDCNVREKAIADALWRASEMQIIADEYRSELLNFIDNMDFGDVSSNPKLMMELRPLPKDMLKKAKNKANERTFALIINKILGGGV